MTRDAGIVARLRAAGMDQRTLVLKSARSAPAGLILRGLPGAAPGRGGAPAWYVLRSPPPGGGIQEHIRPDHRSTIRWNDPEVQTCDDRSAQDDGRQTVL